MEAGPKTAGSMRITTTRDRRGADCDGSASFFAQHHDFNDCIAFGGTTPANACTV
jgi:guanylate kinase